VIEHPAQLQFAGFDLLLQHALAGTAIESARHLGVPGGTRNDYVTGLGQDGGDGGWSDLGLINGNKEHVARGDGMERGQ